MQSDPMSILIVIHVTCVRCHNGHRHASASRVAKTKVVGPPEGQQALSLLPGFWREPKQSTPTPWDPVSWAHTYPIKWLSLSKTGKDTSVWLHVLEHAFGSSWNWNQESIGAPLCVLYSPKLSEDQEHQSPAVSSCWPAPLDSRPQSLCYLDVELNWRGVRQHKLKAKTFLWFKKEKKR